MWVSNSGSDDGQDMVGEIEQFLADDHKRPPGLDLYDDVFKTGLFFPLQRQAELRRMIQIARTVGGPPSYMNDDGTRRPSGNGPKTVMEIGTDKGGGLYHWCKCLPTVERVIACEVRGTPYSEAFIKAFPGIEFRFGGDSREGGKPHWKASFEHDRGNSIDVLFIDGDKGAFIKDFDAYLPLMSPNGVVFMHDINEGGSRMRADFEAVKVRGYRTEEVIDVSDSAAAVDRERAGVPSSCAHESWLRHWHGRSCGVGVVHLEGER